MKTFLLFFLSATCGICNGQNLIPNGGFEQFTSCPTWHSQFYLATPWMNPSTNLAETGTPDYFNQCTANIWCSVPHNTCGDQSAHSGAAYSGIHLWILDPDSAREYIEAPLLSPLIAGNCYHFEMYFSLGENYQYTSDNIGVYFSDTAIVDIPNFFPLPFIPQLNNTRGNVPDTATWKLVSGDYVAQGGESYLIIGNFNNDLNTDTILINASAPGDAVYVYIDDVSLVQTSSCPTGIAGENGNVVLQFYPNPFSNQLTISLVENEPAIISFYDFLGQQILQQAFTRSTVINTEQFTDGIYFYELRTLKENLKTGKVVKQ